MKIILNLAAVFHAGKAGMLPSATGFATKHWIPAYAGMTLSR